MKHTHVIIRYGEISLKGKNRGTFVRRLVKNIKAACKEHCVEVKSSTPVSRIVLETDKDCSFLKRVFGIHSFSYALSVEPELESIKKAALEHFVPGKTFAVKTKRINKNFPSTSHDVDRIVGEVIYEKYKVPANLKHPDTPLHIEIMKDHAFILPKEIKGLGGLPVGCQGNVAAIIQDDSDLLAALLLLKRGCNVYPISKDEKHIDFLKKFCYGSVCVNQTLSPEQLAEKYGVEAVVVGNNTKTEGDLTRLCPTIAFTDEEIKEKLDFYRQQI